MSSNFDQHGQSTHDQFNTQTIAGDVKHQGNVYITNVAKQPQPTIDPAEAKAKLATLPTDRALTAASALPVGSRVTLPINPTFTGRESDLLALAKILKQGNCAAIGEQAAAVTGYGGIGKTQLAVAFAHRYGQYFLGGVYWVNCAEPTAITSEIVACGLRMGLFTSAEGEQVDKLRQTVAAWEADVPRLLIFDNCEDEQILRDYAPKTGASRLLLTSRRSRWSRTSGVETVGLTIFEPAESVRLLRALAEHLTEDEAGEVAAELDHFPLALYVAGSFLHTYRAAISASAYFEKLRTTNPLEHSSLQGRGSEPSATDHTLHVAQTFAVSIDQLGESDVDQLARTMLQHVALFAPNEPIPSELLHLTLADLPLPDDERPFLLIDARNRLLDLGLVEQTNDDITIHKLVASFVQQENPDAAATTSVGEQTILEAMQERNQAGYPAILRVWLPHLTHIVKNALPRADTDAANIAHSLAYHFRQDGNYATALPLYEQVLEIYEVELGSDHPYVATALNNLGGLYYAMGQYEQALPLFERVSRMREAALGSNHPDVAATLNNQGELYRAIGHFEQALPLFERALTIYEAALGSNHPVVATILNNLAALYVSMGQYEQALPLYERALATREATLGSDHPHVATTLNNLAWLLYSKGQYEQALPLFERALTMHETALGSDHPHVATTLHNMAINQYKQGKYEEALGLMERASSVRLTALGDAHPHTQSSLQSLVIISAKVAESAQ